ncbi:DgyrCDS2658 [Dimorphilus gyrociliatus]|uniref:mannose-6-phosphate isomerase n=1 Tax=Dimorphilus gyrociliatus TaxID=2664684 RepID=A0A7I8VBD4_9ANNE|nr:DgyrCDS2658 [Dimorphilus gyrociliatus]
MIELECAVQKYAWGKIGQDSAVASLTGKRNTNFSIDDHPYAELWMGTHPKGPSVIKQTKQTLSDYLKENPEANVQSSKAGQLTFLFKVLSVNKALSIQAHPNKDHAIILHEKDPEHYPDDNHKPEMAIALTKFEGLCGFRPKNEIIDFMSEIEELREIVSNESYQKLKTASNDDSIKAAVKECFSALMNYDADQIKVLLKRTLDNLSKFDERNRKEKLAELFERIHSQFPGDVGCYCVYFLNFMKLEPGEAMFLRANLPHAYLSGDCVECMACSDNVVRAGLTPKFKDVEVLTQMLDYSCKSAQDNLFQHNEQDSFCKVYSPPVLDFAVDKITIPANQNYTLPEKVSASIILVVDGCAEAQESNIENGISEGGIYLLPAKKSVNLFSKKDLLLFRSYTPL